MKQPRKRLGFFNIQIFFTFVVMAEIIVTVAAAAELASLLGGALNVSLRPRTLLWLILFSFIIGAVCAFLVNRIIFAPVKRLSESMRRVAEGNFGLKLETKSRITEIDEIYQSFNLMEKQLAATEILQTDFVSNVSHEFKTPISVIEGYATLLQDESLTDAQRGEYAQRILLNTGRLSQLAGNILLLSRVDNQAIQAPCRTFSLDEQIRQAIVLLEPRWDEKEIEFDVELDSAEFTGDENMLMHVWSNLIGNAIKFSPHGGMLTIRLRRKKDALMFTLDDQGPGIEPEAMAHIFEKFYQGDGSHRQEGNGLGLALVKRILDRYGGEVWAENLSGGGCRFSVRLRMDS